MTTTIHSPRQSGTAEDPSDGGGGDRFVASTLLVIAAVLALVQVLAAEVIPPLAAFMAIFAAMGAAVWRWRPRWLLAVAGVLGAVYLVGSLPFLTANLAHPESPGSFLAEAFLVIGVAALLLGVIGGIRGARPGARRPIAIGAAAVAALAVAVSAVAALGVDSDARQPGDVVIEALRSHFPEVVEVPAGDAALWVDNQDAFHHTIVVEGADVRAALPASSAVRVPLRLDPGTYRYLCDVPGHESMQGELHVR